MIEKWLEESVKDHIRKRPELYSHCPTPDCPSVYLRKNEHMIWTCPICFAQACTKCHSEQHFPRTCVEHTQDRIIRELELQERERQLAMRETKPCPKWGVLIPKDDECNPVLCPGCRSQVCWFRKEAFVTDEERIAHFADVRNGYVRVANVAVVEHKEEAVQEEAARTEGGNDSNDVDTSDEDNKSKDTSNTSKNDLPFPVDNACYDNTDKKDDIPMGVVHEKKGKLGDNRLTIHTDRTFDLGASMDETLHFRAYMDETYELCIQVDEDNKVERLNLTVDENNGVERVRVPVVENKGLEAVPVPVDDNSCVEGVRHHTN
jgi:hypothetical protein